jgi:pyruvate decarboxylase
MLMLLLAICPGHYLGSISSPCTCEIVESADLVVAVGCVWTDYRQALFIMRLA